MQRRGHDFSTKSDDRRDDASGGCSSPAQRDASERRAQELRKHYVLPAIRRPRSGLARPAKPKLVVNSGDTVPWNSSSCDGRSTGRLHRRDRSSAGDPGATDSVTGPIYVRAEPGDTLEIRIKKIVIKEDGFNFSLPASSSLPLVCCREFPEDMSNISAGLSDEDGVQTGPSSSAEAFPARRGGPDPNEPKKKRPRSTMQGPHQHAAAVEERVQHDVNELQEARRFSSVL